MNPSKLSTLTAAALFVVSLSSGLSQPTGAAKAIENVLGDYFRALSARDAAGMTRVLDRQFVAMDAVTERGIKNARIEFIDTTNAVRLLPPEGNSDMSNMTVSSLSVKFSESNPTVAVASFVASRPLTPKESDRFKTALAATATQDAGADRADYNAKRAIIQNWVDTGRIQFAMLAMLGRRDGQWRIVCMSFPE